MSAINLPSKIENILGPPITDIYTKKIGEYNTIFHILKSHNNPSYDSVLKYLNNPKLNKLFFSDLGDLYVCDDLTTFLIPYDKSILNEFALDKFNLQYFEYSNEYYIILKYDENTYLDLLKTFQTKHFGFFNNTIMYNNYR
jgi:hypothetical protein